MTLAVTHWVKKLTRTKARSRIQYYLEGQDDKLKTVVRRFEEALWKKIISIKSQYRLCKVERQAQAGTRGSYSAVPSDLGNHGFPSQPKHLAWAQSWHCPKKKSFFSSGRRASTSSCATDRDHPSLRRTHTVWDSLKTQGISFTVIVKSSSQGLTVRLFLVHSSKSHSLTNSNVY